MTVARKAAAKKTPKTVERTPKTVEQKVADFSEYRQRASGFAFTTDDAETKPPFLVKGFDPPIAVAFPTELSEQIALDQYMRRRDFFGALGILLGGQLMRVAQAFGKEKDGMALLAGLTLKIIDHFTGPGASDVEGGSPAS